MYNTCLYLPSTSMHQIYNTYVGLSMYVCLFGKVQCRYLITAPNAWAARALYTTARLIATQFPWHRCNSQLNVDLIRRLCK